MHIIIVNKYTLVSNVVCIAYLGYTKLPFLPKLFKSYNIASPRGGVERSRRWQFLGPDCILSAVGQLILGYILVIYILGGYARGLVVFGAAVRIGQL